MFQCHWDIPLEQKDVTIVEDGPIPWCRRDQLTFIAEQVSHHPPSKEMLFIHSFCFRNKQIFICLLLVSAFYAEHYNKKISFSAHVWTKSKFLGLSIGVHNIGQGIVTLTDLNEEYILTFPNGYGRWENAFILNKFITSWPFFSSILTVPWIELGGTVTINCPQTGYHADIDFLTKPFYGGKRNKISTEVNMTFKSIRIIF